MHKKETSLPDYIYLLCCYFVLQSLFNVYKSWSIYKTYKIMEKYVK